MINLLCYRIYITLCLFIYVISNAKKISFFEKLKKKNPQEYINYIKSINVISNVEFKINQNLVLGNEIIMINYNKEIDVNQKNQYLLYEIPKDFVLNTEWILENKKDLFNKFFSKIKSQGKYYYIYQK